MILSRAESLWWILCRSKSKFNFPKIIKLVEIVLISCPSRFRRKPERIQSFEQSSMMSQIEEKSKRIMASKNPGLKSFDVPAFYTKNHSIEIGHLFPIECQTINILLLFRYVRYRGPFSVEWCSSPELWEFRFHCHRRIPVWFSIWFTIYILRFSKICVSVLVWVCSVCVCESKTRTNLSHLSVSAFRSLRHAELWKKCSQPLPGRLRAHGLPERWKIIFSELISVFMTSHIRRFFDTFHFGSTYIHFTRAHTHTLMCIYTPSHMRVCMWSEPNASCFLPREQFIFFILLFFLRSTADFYAHPHTHTPTTNAGSASP